MLAVQWLYSLCWMQEAVNCLVAGLKAHCMMETVLRRLRLKRGDSQESDARKRLQKELFGFAAVCQLLLQHVRVKFCLHDNLYV